MVKGMSGLIDRIVSFVFEIAFSKERKIERILVLLMAVGFVVRLIAALNLGVLADDMVFASQSAGIMGSGIISTHSNPPLFFYLTDLAFKFLGYTTLASRFWPLIAGTMLILVIFLITARFFGKRVALLAAFFATFSNFLVRMTFSEQSLLLFFFCFLATYVGLLYLDSKKVHLLVISAIIFGLALLTKYNAPFFIICFLLFAVYLKKKNGEKILTKQNIKHLAIFGAILVLFALPFLTFNYLLYNDKGIVDVYFSRLIHVDKAQQFYGGLAGQERSFFQNVMLPSNYGNYSLLYHTDLILLIFALFGFTLATIRKNKEFLVFFALFLLIPFMLQSAGAPLAKHFAFMPLLFSIFAGYGLDNILGKFKNRSVKYAVILLIATVMVVNLGTAYSTPASYLHPSGTSALKSYINNEVGAEDLILFDARIYTARSFWLATDHNFLTLNNFVEFYNYDKNLSTRKSVTRVHIVECVTDDCGWGWVSQNPELNSSSEELITSLKNYSTSSTDIKSYEYSGNEIIGSKDKNIEYRVYTLEVPLTPELVAQTKQINSFYFAPYMYLNMKGYSLSYNASGLGSIMESISHLIIYAAMILTFIVIILAVFFL